MTCCKCGTKIEPSGMCCNSGADSGYQCFCEKCGVMWIDTFDGRILVDSFLTAIAFKRELQKKTAEKFLMH